MVGAAVWAIRRREYIVPLSLGWIAAALLIVANLLAPTGILLAERTLYLPSVGAVLLVAWLWNELTVRVPSVAAAALAVVLAAGAVRTVTRNPIWRDDDAYYPAMVRDAPGSFRADWTAAELARRRGDLTESERLLRRAIQVYPLGWAVWQDLGKLLYQEGRFSEAAEAFWAAWKITEGSSFHAQRAIQSDLIAGNLGRAEWRLDQARAARPNRPVELLLAESDVALARGEFVRAMTWRRLAAWSFPDSTRYWALTAQAAIRAKHCDGLRHSLAYLRRLPGGEQVVRELAGSARPLQCE
jgi:predicted Zn-dependent protease